MVVGVGVIARRKRLCHAESARLATLNLRLSSTSFLASPPTSCPSFESPLSFERMLLSSLFLILAGCAIGIVPAAATPHSLAGRSSHHNAVQPFQKRASGQFTFFAVGLGACGKQNTDDDFVSISFRLYAVAGHYLFAILRLLH